MGVGGTVNKQVTPDSGPQVTSLLQSLHELRSIEYYRVHMCLKGDPVW